MAVKERKRKSDHSENKIKPSSISDPAMHVLVSFTLEGVSTFWLVSTLTWFWVYIQENPVLIVTLICWNSDMQVSALPNTQCCYGVLQGNTYFPLLLLVHRPG